MNIPLSFRSGDSFAWLDNATTDLLGLAVDSSTYTLKYALRGPSILTLTAIAEGSGWKTSITTTQSDLLSAGRYYWQAWAEKTSTKVTLGAGTIDVLANLLNQNPNFDGRTQARKDLDAVQLAMRTITAGGAVAEYTIGNRSMKKMTMSELMAYESRLKVEVVREEAAQKIANGQGNPNATFVRFTR